MSVSMRTPSARGGQRRPRRRPIPPRTPGPSPAPSSEAGFTLIEVLVAAVVLIVGLGALFGLLDSSVKATALTRAREGASNLARQVLEQAHTIPYAQLSPGAVTEELQALGLKDESAESGWQIVRRGITYTVLAEECAIDDPKDGYGKHEIKTNYCSESQTETTSGANQDTQPEDLKRITVVAKWTLQGRSREVRQAQTIAYAGQAIGLSTSGLRLISPTGKEASSAPLISEPTIHELEFEVTAPSSTTAVYWSLEGARQSTAALHPSGTRWTFLWNITGVSDGTYEVAAQAVNASDVVGPPISFQVTLIRGEPAAPSGIKGGFNKVLVSGLQKQVSELQWQANSERNVIGYRVYNPSGGLVCPGSLSTVSLAISCIDFNPPAFNAPNLQYKVVALYRKAAPVGETLSEEISASLPGPLTLLGSESKPNPPVNLKLEKNAEGAAVLKWEPPSTGPTPAFYRIYRGTTDYTGRYDVTGSGTTYTYTDTETGGTSHSYWVTSATSNLTESPTSEMLGPVVG